MADNEQLFSDDSVHSSDDEADVRKSKEKEEEKKKNQSSRSSTISMPIPFNEDSTKCSDPPPPAKKSKTEEGTSEDIGLGCGLEKKSSKVYDDSDFFAYDDSESLSFAFCCSKCICTDHQIATCKQFNQFVSCFDPGIPGDGGNSELWHKGCCHRMKTFVLSPIGQARKEGKKMAGKPKPVNVKIAKPLTHIQTKKNTAAREETKRVNKSNEVGECFLVCFFAIIM